MVVCREGVGCDVGFFWRQDNPVIDEILNLMAQSKAQVGVVTVLLMERTILGWIVGCGESFR